MDKEFFPFVGTEKDYIISTNTALPTFKEYAYDFKNERYITDKKTNDLIIIEGKKALEVWMYHAIKTIRYEHEIYSWDYGTEIVDLVGQKFTKGLTESEAFRYIKEALLINPYILEVKNKGITFNGDTLKVSIKVDTIYGLIDLKGVDAYV